MDILLVISHADAARLAKPLAEACARMDVDWGCFFTGDGVKSLSDEAFADLVAASADEAVVCAEAWKDRMPRTMECPVDLGSQFHHSGMAAKADKVVSF